MFLSSPYSQLLQLMSGLIHQHTTPPFGKWATPLKVSSLHALLTVARIWSTPGQLLLQDKTPEPSSQPVEIACLWSQLLCQTSGQWPALQQVPLCRQVTPGARARRRAVIPFAVSAPSSPAGPERDLILRWLVFSFQHWARLRDLNGCTGHFISRQWESNDFYLNHAFSKFQRQLVISVIYVYAKKNWKISCMINNGESPTFKSLSIGKNGLANLLDVKNNEALCFKDSYVCWIKSVDFIPLVKFLG